MYQVYGPQRQTTLNLSGTVSEINALLETLIYAPDAGYNGFDTLTITTDDLGNSGSGGALQDVDAFQITVGNPYPPALNLDADDSSGAGGNDFATSWTEGSGPVLVADGDATLVDSDENMTGVVVTITNLLDGTAELLAADTSGTSIVASYDSATGVLTLSGSDTAANYQQVLRTITYDNTSDMPSTTARAITFTATDAASTGNTATTTLAIGAVNDAPVNTVPGAQATTQDTPIVFSSGSGNAISVSDVDVVGNDEVEVTVAVTDGTLTLDTIAVVGATEQVNTTEAFDQISPDVAYAADGSSVVVFALHDSATNNRGIYFQLYNPDGTPNGGEVLIGVADTTSEKNSPQVAMDAAGNFVVVWEEQDTGGTQGITAQMFFSDGTANGADFLVNTTQGGEQVKPAVAMNANGMFVIAWSGAGATDADGIYYQRYQASGTLLGVETQANVNAANVQSDVAVASTTPGTSCSPGPTQARTAAEPASTRARSRSLRSTLPRCSSIRRPRARNRTPMSRSRRMARSSSLGREAVLATPTASSSSASRRASPRSAVRPSSTRRPAARSPIRRSRSPTTLRSRLRGVRPARRASSSSRSLRTGQRSVRRPPSRPGRPEPRASRPSPTASTETSVSQSRAPTPTGEGSTSSATTRRRSPSARATAWPIRRRRSAERSPP